MRDHALVFIMCTRSVSFSRIIQHLSSSGHSPIIPSPVVYKIEAKFYDADVSQPENVHHNRAGSLFSSSYNLTPVNTSITSKERL